jgi:hypothetical protein
MTLRCSLRYCLRHNGGRQGEWTSRALLNAVSPRALDYQRLLAKRDKSSGSALDRFLVSALGRRVVRR